MTTKFTQTVPIYMQQLRVGRSFLLEKREVHSFGIKDSGYFDLRYMYLSLQTRPKDCGEHKLCPDSCPPSA